MKYILLLLLISCGVDLHHDGVITHKVELNVAEIIMGFEAYCDQIGAENIDTCVDEQLVKYFRDLAKEQYEFQTPTSGN